MEKESITENVRRGLSSAQAEESRRAHGENVLTPPKRTPLWKLYLEKYNDPIIKVLLVAAAVSLALAIIENEFVEVIGIFLAIFLATTIGFYFERDAAKKFDVLTAIGEESPVKVVRDGKVQEVGRREVVVGDVVLLGVGDEVPADGTLFEATDLQIDESALTGEPIISKFTDVRNDGATYPSNMALRSTMVMNGSGRMVVTAVGDATEIGKVARKSTEMTSVKTPLNMQLDRLAKLISKVGTGVAVAAFVIFLGHDIMTNSLWHTDDYLRMAETVLRYFMVSVTLIVMAVPEGLPMAVTLALALNMRRMLKSNNLVRKLHACETMGAVTVICTDKTGTLTQNKMQVQEMWAEGADAGLLRAAIAANSTAELDGDKPIGNPTEGALLLWMHREGHDYRRLRSENGVVWQLPFSTERKYMATIAEVQGRRYLFMKGAPEIVARYCDMGEADRAAFANYLPHCKMPVCYNGDITTPAQLKALEAEFPNLSGIMVGRGIIADPALLRQAVGGAPASKEELRGYLDELYHGYTEAFGMASCAVSRMKAHWHYLIQRFEGSEAFEKQLRKAREGWEYEVVVNQLFTLPLL